VMIAAKVMRFGEMVEPQYSPVNKPVA